MTHLLQSYDPRGVEPVSLKLRTPLRQTVSAVTVTLYTSAGVYLGGKRAQFYVRNLSLPNRSIAEGCILSFPGSGNHLVRFMIEFLTRRPTRGCSDLRDVPLYLSDYGGENPLAEVDPAAVPATEKWHWTRSYPPVYEEPRNFSARCRGRLVFVLRDLHEAVPRWFKVFTEHQGEPAPAERRVRLALDTRALVDNAEAFAAHQGPKLLVHYADLLGHPDRVVEQLGTLFGVEEARVAEWGTRSEALTAACRGAAHGSWQGQRSRGGEGGHLSGWSEEQVAELAAVAGALVDAASPAAQALLRPSLLRLWRTRRRVPGS